MDPGDGLGLLPAELKNGESLSRGKAMRKYCWNGFEFSALSRATGLDCVGDSEQKSASHATCLQRPNQVCNPQHITLKGES